MSIVFPGGVATNLLVNSGGKMPAGLAASEGAEIKATSAADAGRQIITAVEKGTYRVRIGSDARLLDRLSRLAPQRATTLIADRMQSLLDN